jgi:hypothetical protein
MLSWPTEGLTILGRDSFMKKYSFHYEILMSTKFEEKTVKRDLLQQKLECE